MSAAPVVLTEGILQQREAQPVTFIQAQEVLRVKTPAYSASKSDISFQIRQPSASAICTNYVELLLELEFTTSGNATVKQTQAPGSAGDEDRYKAVSAASTDYGFVAEGLPFQSKCVRNSVVTINGVSQSHRMSEFGKMYSLMHCSKKYMEKIGNGWNSYTKQYLKKDGAGGVYASGNRDLYAMSDSEAKQYDAWKQQLTQDGSAAVQNVATTARYQVREPLFMGPFGAFAQCEEFPAWSCEGQKSAGILHMHNFSLQLALEENWWKALYLPIYQQTANGFAEVTDVTIRKAELLTKWVLPPPRLVSAALTQQASLATYDVLRFIAEPKEQIVLHDQGKTEFVLNNISFPYMPSLFMFEIAPHYSHCSGKIAGPNEDPTMLEAYKKDKRVTITHMELSVNTSSSAVPFQGAQSVQVVRINARDLYNMTMENVASMIDFPYTFEEWFRNCGIVALTPGQMSGALASPNIRGNVVVQGTVFCQNFMGCPVNVSTGGKTFGGSDAVHASVYDAGEPVPRYRCLVSGIYSNRAMILDSKSGLMTEATYSQAYNQQLALGAGGAAQ